VLHQHSTTSSLETCPAPPNCLLYGHDGTHAWFHLFWGAGALIHSSTVPNSPTFHHFPPEMRRRGHPAPPSTAPTTQHCSWVHVRVVLRV
jgi:hypothetical protein